MIETLRELLNYIKLNKIAAVIVAGSYDFEQYCVYGFVSCDDRSSMTLEVNIPYGEIIEIKDEFIILKHYELNHKELVDNFVVFILLKHIRSIRIKEYDSSRMLKLPG